MKYYSVTIFVDPENGNLTNWGSAPAFGEIGFKDWGLKPVRQLILTRPDKKVFVEVYRADVSMDVIKKIAGDFVAQHP